MLFCRKYFSPLQRRFVALFSFTLIATAVLFVVHISFGEGHLGFNGGHSAKPLAYLLSVLPAVPFLGMMLLIPRYLAREKDEFVRTLVIRALLWGFAVPMVIDTVWGFFWKVSPVSAVMPMLNVDLFCITAMIAVRVQGWRYQ